MATVINNPSGTTADTNSGAGWIVGIILLLVLGFLFFQYGLPAMRGGRVTNVNVQLPDVKPTINNPIDVTPGSGGSGTSTQGSSTSGGTSGSTSGGTSTGGTSTTP